MKFTDAALDFERLAWRWCDSSSDSVFPGQVVELDGD